MTKIVEFSKKHWLLTSVLFFGLLCGIAYAADTALSGLAANSSPSTDDLIYTVDDPGGTPASKKTTVQELTDFVHGDLVAGDIPDLSATYQTVLANSAGLRGALDDETGTGAAVFGTSPTILTPSLTSKITGNAVSVNDDDCTGEQGLWWYDDTDNQFEFCNANSGTPVAISVSGGTVDTSGTPVANDYARFTDVDTIEGRSYSEARTDLGLVIGTDVQAYDAELTGDAVDPDRLAGDTINNDLVDQAIIENFGPGTTATPGAVFYDSDAAGADDADEETGGFDLNLETATEDAEDGSFHFWVMEDGTRTDYVQLDGNLKQINLNERPIVLDDNDSIDFDATADGMDDDEYNGQLVVGRNCGETLTQWDVVEIVDDADPWHKADATAASGEYPAFGLSIAACTDTNEAKILVRGIVRNEGWTGLTVAGPVYLGETDGALTQTAPSTSNDAVQIIGWALSDSEIYFDFSRPYQLVE